MNPKILACRILLVHIQIPLTGYMQVPYNTVPLLLLQVRIAVRVH